MGSREKRSSKAQPARRQYRRGAETRELLLRTTIDCIHARGYGGTSIETVMAEAGVSRGSVLHQFPSRADLMCEVADKTLKEQAKEMAARLGAIEDPEERLLRYSDVSWAVHRLPEGTALTEILLAARWDRELARTIAPRIERHETGLDKALRRIARDAGIEDGSRYIVLARLINSSIRGFTIQLMFDPTRATILKCLDELKTVYQTGCRDMLREAKRKSPAGKRPARRNDQ